MCDYKAARQSYLRRHTIVKHSQRKGFFCSRCLKNFTDKLSLDKHKEIRHAKFKYPLCSFKSATWKSLVDHHKIVHNNAMALQKPFQCSKCLAFFVHERSLTVHVDNASCQIVYHGKLHTETPRFKHSSTRLEVQSVKVQSDEKKVIVNKAKAANKKSSKAVQSKDEKFHVCQACYEQFPSLKVLKRHLKYCVFDN
jgi:hypothetical protein